MSRSPSIIISHAGVHPVQFNVIYELYSLYILWYSCFINKSWFKISSIKILCNLLEFSIEWDPKYPNTMRRKFLSRRSQLKLQVKRHYVAKNFSKYYRSDVSRKIQRILKQTPLIWYQHGNGRVTLFKSWHCLVYISREKVFPLTCGWWLLTWWSAVSSAKRRYYNVHIIYFSLELFM